MKATLILWTHSKKKNGTHPIKVRIQDGANKTIYKNTGKSIHKMFWRDGRVVKHPQANSMNAELKDILTQVEANYNSKGSAVTGDSESFYWWFERQINLSKTIHGYYHVRKLTTILNKLKLFRADIKVKHLNKILLQDLEAWLLKDGRNPNYIADIFKRMRAVWTDVVDAGLAGQNPFKKYKITTHKKEKQRLTLKHIDKLAKIKPKNENVLLARDMYLFSFYCAGIRFGDLCRLKHHMVEKGRLIYIMHKSLHTGNPKIRNIKLRKEAIEIIRRQKTAGYIFHTKVDWKDEDKSISDRNAFFNKKLKLACIQADVPKISFHTSRNSFADLAIGKKVDAHKLKEMLGHSKIATTEVYMKDFYQEETDEAMDQIFGS